jgi:uncharacterized protein YijF (DUF1287 family)
LGADEIRKVGENRLKTAWRRVHPGTALTAALIWFIGGPADPAFAQGRLSREFVKNLLSAAVEQTGHPSVYDGSYRLITYPGGDVPPAP